MQMHAAKDAAAQANRLYVQRDTDREMANTEQAGSQCLDLRRFRDPSAVDGRLSCTSMHACAITLCHMALLHSNLATEQGAICAGDKTTHQESGQNQSQ